LIYKALVVICCRTVVYFYIKHFNHGRIRVYTAPYAYTYIGETYNIYNKTYDDTPQSLVNRGLQAVVDEVQQQIRRRE